MKFAVVVVAYNRPAETRRLVDAVCAAQYGGDTVDLIVDIDKGQRQEEIRQTIADVPWSRGEYRLVMRPERMGLRPHVFACGDYTETYDAVIVLEDDLIVAPSFYLYSKKACEYYDADERVSQISLYSYAVNEFEARPFYPARDDADVFAMQVVQSWGECWTKRMWAAFRRSESAQKTEFEFNPDLHTRVNEWKKNSWKKVFFNYLIESDTWVIYPYDALSSNYSEAGEHCKWIVSDYQVVMQSAVKEEYSFKPLDACIRYDAFFERVLPSELFFGKKLCLDLYGSRHRYDGYDLLASTARLPYRVEERYGLIRKPQEENVIHRESGDGIFLYDLSVPAPLPEKNEKHLIRYDYGYLAWRRSVKHGLYAIRDKLADVFGRKHF